MKTRGCFLGGVALAVGLASPAPAEVLYGFTNFPHELSASAAERIHAITVPNSTLYAQHMDQCLPWHAAISGEPFPRWLENVFDEIRAYRQPHQTMYVAVTPTDVDRHSLANACSDVEDETRDPPAALRGAAFDDPAVMDAYVNYVRRVADALDPSYMNIGIEVSEMMLQAPRKWAGFDRLFRHTVDAMRQSHPDIRIGLELGAHTIMKPGIGDTVKPTAEYGDYVGLSFYPYASEFAEFFGVAPLPSPPDQWRAPLAFARNWTSKPLAVAETGYTTRNHRLNIGSGINFPGDEQLQERYLEDLIDTAIRDEYEFIVWFVPVDYTRLLDSFGSGAPEWMKIWVNAGLFDHDLKPKPAFALWSRWRDQASPPAGGPAAQAAPRASAAAGPPTLTCSSRASQLSESADRPEPGVGVTQWTLRFGDDWELCATPFAAGPQAAGLAFWTRSAPGDMLLVQVTEGDGDAFFALVESTSGWTEVTMPWSAFEPAPSAAGDGRLDPADITGVTFGEGSGSSGVTGERVILLSQPKPM